MSQRRPDLTSGLFKFSSLEEVMKYLREATEFYTKESEKYGDKLGSMLRTGPAEPAPVKEDDKKKNDKKLDKAKGTVGGWIKMGSLLINSSNPGTASTEVMYQVHEELKQKLARTAEAIKSLEQNASTMIPPNATLQLYMRNGVPEKLVIEAQERKKQAFSFDGRFRVV